MNVSVENRGDSRPVKDGGGSPPTWDQAGFGPDEEPLDLRALIRPFWRRRWLILACLLAGLAAGVFVAMNTVPRFTANARVIFDPERLKIIDLDNVVVAADTSTTGMQNQVEILRSSVLLQRVVDILRLKDTPEFNPDLRLGPAPLFERIADRLSREIDRLPLPTKAKALLIEVGVLKPVPEEPLTEEAKADALQNSIVKQLVEEMKLKPVPNSRVIEIGYTSTNGGVAASIVNAVADQYIAVQIEKKRDDVAAATELLGVRVQDLENRLNVAEDAVEVARMESRKGRGPHLDQGSARDADRIPGRRASRPSGDRSTVFPGECCPRRRREVRDRSGVPPVPDHRRVPRARECARGRGRIAAVDRRR